MIKSNMARFRLYSRGFGGSALLTLLATGAQSQTVVQPFIRADCALIKGALPDHCIMPDTLPEAAIATDGHANSGQFSPLTATGFQILIDGQVMVGDPDLKDELGQSGHALKQADLKISVDGLGAKPRLALQRSNASEGLKAGDHVTFTSEMNYPAYVVRGELRIIDRNGIGAGGKILAVLPIDPNGQASLVVPNGGRIVAVHRVYDRQGRYDETRDLPVSYTDDRGLSDTAETGVDARHRHSIPVRGGAVTISGENVSPGATIHTLGEAILPAQAGDFVLQRILPVGEHRIDVEISGPDAPLGYSQNIKIPRVDAFYTAMTDATIGKSSSRGGSETYTRGRLAFYTHGYMANGIEFTAAADTAESEIRDLFSSFDAKDPASLLRRIDPNEFYPTYGDGSTILDDAPTQGNFYLRLKRDKNYFIWGNSQAELGQSEYLRNERVLYGANTHWESQTQTSFGEPRAQVTLYASRPDNLAQRDVLRGTGGSIYFLSRQDITRGSEVVFVELRDPVGGRVIDRKHLSSGQDYEVNYLQGSIRLSKPLPSSSGTGVVVTGPGGDAEVNLVVQYEYTPVDMSVDGWAAGARIAAWINDRIRLGLSGQHDDTGLADQNAYGADVLYRLSESSFIEAEYVRSDGPGYGQRNSIDGGLIYDTTDPASGAGRAQRLKAEIDLKELGLAVEGVVNAYYESRSEGFSSLDYTVTSGERLWGFDATVKQSEGLSWRTYWDDFKNERGRRESAGGAEILYMPDAKNSFAFGLEHIRRRSAQETGSRTDVALRYTRQVTDQFNWSLLGQATVWGNGLSRNDRLGVGIKRDFGNGWTFAGEVSDGTLGLGGDILASFARKDGSSLYFGYEIDPDAFDNQSALGSLSANKGKVVFGGRRQVNQDVSIYGENTYDMFGPRDALTSAYGVDYAPSEYLTYSMGFDLGRVRDDKSGDLNRRAVSLGAKYQDDQLTASGRVEYRRERAEKGRVSSLARFGRDTDTLLLTANATYRIDEGRTLLAYVDYADSDGNQSSIRNGILADVVLGYAIRPVDHDRFNLLFKYRYYHDMYGQTVDGTSTRGPLQKSQVFTVDAEYDLNQKWSIGGKLGGRFAKSTRADSSEFYKNDAWLAVANLRFHVVQNWDMLFELRSLRLHQAKTTEFGAVAAAYRHFGDNVKVGVGYNFGSFSDDLTDLTRDDKGAFLNLIITF